mmetsp:Transcript_46801/g.80560  ORF Transcript_46801/g.80560 Transcript_46801/m.80560 type:complete len:134 (+) Transcript_46801:239-640(+)
MKPSGNKQAERTGIQACIMLDCIDHHSLQCIQTAKHSFINRNKASNTSIQSTKYQAVTATFFFLWPSNEVFALCCKKHVATDPRWKSALHKSLFPPRASIAFGAYSKSWMFLSKSEASIPSDGGSKTKLAPIT